MIRRRHQRDTEVAEVSPRSFDDFELRLGDVMRGERATLGKSLLDVQRELRIKAGYIAAIENCDPSAFDTPGFIAGYVRSYARYLNLDPDETFTAFCEESGFTTAHGMSHKASTIRKSDKIVPAGSGGRDIFANPALPFAPGDDSFLTRIEPAAIGSSLILVALIAGIGYGGWSVLREVQRVQLAPIEQTPVVLSDLDPLQSNPDPLAQGVTGPDPTGAAGVFDPPSAVTAMDRLYRPQALDVPVLVARDAPISTLDPRSVGSFAEDAFRDLAKVEDATEPDFPRTASPLDLARGIPADGATQTQTSTQTQAQAQTSTLGTALPQVVEALGPGVTVMAVREAWVRVRSADGTSIYEAIMQAGDTFQVPQTEDAANIRVGESGAIYFVVNGQTYGPAGSNGAVTSNLALSSDNLTTAYQVADMTTDNDLARVFAELTLAPETPGAVAPTE